MQEQRRTLDDEVQSLVGDLPEQERQYFLTGEERVMLAQYDIRERGFTDE